MIVNLINQINTGGELPSVMQNIGIALLTAFIPIALFLFSQINEKSEEYGVLDKSVLLDYVVRIKHLLWQCSLIFLPLLFWDINIVGVRIFIFIIWCSGVVLVSYNLSGPYRWIRKDKLEFRLNYLIRVKTSDELPKLWKSVWNSSGKDIQNDEKFFKIFQTKVDEILFNEEDLNKINLLAKLINDFKVYINNRPFVFLTAPNGVFQKVLEWHHEIWTREYKYILDKTKLAKFGSYFDLSSILDSIIRSVAERALRDDMAYGFFDLIGNHVEKYKKDYIVGDKINYYYTQNLLTVFYNPFLDNIEKARDRYDIWSHYFPKSWLITKENITDQDNIPARVTLECFLNWAVGRIKLPESDKVELDMDLDSVSKEIFPTTEPFFWGTMLTFIFRPWGGDSRMKTLVEYPRNFGHVGRIYSTWSQGDENAAVQQLEENRQNELHQSIDLLLTLFPNHFTKVKLEEYLRELEGLAYKEDNKNYAKKQQLITYFKTILDSLNPGK